jgi:hypothetical protein
VTELEGVVTGGRSAGLGLECRATGLDLVIPERFVDQVIELRMSPLPLAAPWVRGVAIHAERVVVIFGVDDDANAEVEPAREIKAVLLALPGVSTTFAIGVDWVSKFVSVVRRERVDDWFERANAPDGRELLWLDVERLRVRVIGSEGGVDA